MNRRAQRNSAVAGRKARRHSYITDLHYFAAQFRDSLPLLHRVTIQSGADDRSPIPNEFGYAWSRSVGDRDPGRRDTIQPFPSMAELLELPVIKNLLARDVGVGRFDDALYECEDQIQHEIEEWETGVERALVDILQSGQNLPDSEATNSKVTMIPSPTGYLNIRPPGPLDDTTIPKSTIMFPQGLTCSTDTSRLSETTKLLLRADSRFIRKGVSVSYPFVCLSRDVKPQFSADNIRSYGAKWNQDPISFDKQGSMICQRLLAKLGRPDAMHAELSIIGNNFKCGRCGFPPTIWEVMVGHYREESDRWEQVQTIQKDQSSPIPFNNTHDLTSNENKALVYMVSPKVAHESLTLNYAQLVDRRFCDLCTQIGLEPRSYRLVATDEECALIRHLREVHDEHRPVWSSFKRDLTE